VYRFIRQYLMAVATYLTVVPGGVVATLALASAVGYLPYSDRPGPGWHHTSLSLAQLSYYLSWATFLIVPSLCWVTGIFLWLKLVHLLGTPRPVTRLLGGAVAGAFSLVLILAIGWYISIAELPIDVGGLLGAVWGAALAPRYLGSPLQPPLARLPRIGLVALAVVIPPVAAWALVCPR